MRLAESPNWFMIMNVPRGATINVATTINALRTFPKNRNNTITTKAIPSTSALLTVLSAASTNSLRS
jgi:hypothetical protein